MNKHVFHAAGLLGAYGSQAEQTLTADDRLALIDLVQSLELAVDSRDFEAMRNILATDWSHIAAFGRYNTPDEFITDIQRQNELFDGIRHQHVNIVVRSQGHDRAVVLSYIIVVQVSDPEGTVQDGMPRIIGHGVSRDEAERQNGTWRLVRRIIDQTSVLPSMLPDADLRHRFGQVVATEAMP
ncbi:MAG: nuclear transport factor 2 family protein [Leptolyngbya sp. IPPAS B-1204]|nr:MAG: nuclear transport factor 2 family protein [Leptolyngbya sp. IPPAS B-1204]